MTGTITLIARTVSNHREVTAPSRSVTAADSAALARLLLDEAQAGDEVSLALVTQHGQALGDYALAAARQVGLAENYLLVTSGGVMRHPSTILRDALLERVQAAHPEVRWQASPHEPVTGAVLLALEQSGVQVTPEVFQRLSDTCPPASFFET